jgi:hypothetical protein
VTPPSSNPDLLALSDQLVDLVIDLRRAVERPAPLEREALPDGDLFDPALADMVRVANLEGRVISRLAASTRILTEAIGHLRTRITDPALAGTLKGLYRPLELDQTEADTALQQAVEHSTVLAAALGQAAEAALDIHRTYDTGRLARMIYGHIADEDPGVEHLLDQAVTICDANLARLKQTDPDAARILAHVSFTAARTSLEAEHRLISAIYDYTNGPGAGHRNSLFDGIPRP